MDLISDRRRRVTIEELDWQKCLDVYDRPTTFFFLDPPYTSCDAGVYGAWKISDVLRFRERIKQTRNGE